MTDDMKDPPEQPSVGESNEEAEKLCPSSRADVDNTVPMVRKRTRAIATRRQTAANRANAMRSTGPRTVEGKEIAARNAIRHGLTSRSVLLPGEDQTEYQRFADLIRIDCAPHGQLEEEFVKMMTDAMWARRRVSPMEASALEHLTSDEVDPTASADVLVRTLQLLDRYATGKERVIFRALQALQRSQDRRREELEFSPQEQMLGLQDQQRILQDLADERDPQAPCKRDLTARTKNDARQGHRPASSRALAIVHPPKPPTEPKE